MRTAALLLAASAYGVLAAALATAYDHVAWPLSALVIGAAWLGLLLWRPRAAAHCLFVVIATLGAAAALAAGSELLALAAAAAALLAWDAAGARLAVSPLAPLDRTRIARRYAPQAILLGLMSFAVAAFSRTVLVRLTFVAAIALSLIVLACLALLLWQSGRFQRAPESDTTLDDRQKRDGAKPL